MSYDVIKDEYTDNLIVYPLELPMYKGDPEDLERQAMVTLTSCLRHLAVADTIVNDFSEDEDTNYILAQHRAQGAQLLVSTMMCLASIANAYGIDIMQEIYEAPWAE